MWDLIAAAVGVVAVCSVEQLLIFLQCFVQRSMRISTIDGTCERGLELHILTLFTNSFAPCVRGEINRNRDRKIVLLPVLEVK